MMHVGTNVADKQLLISRLHRVLRPGGYLGIYDVMRVGDGDLSENRLARLELIVEKLP